MIKIMVKGLTRRQEFLSPHWSCYHWNIPPPSWYQFRNVNRDFWLHAIKNMQLNVENKKNDNGIFSTVSIFILGNFGFLIITNYSYDMKYVIIFKMK